MPKSPLKPASLMHNLGAFFGEIAKAVKTDVTPPPPTTHTLSAQEETRPVETPLGPGLATTRTTDELAVQPATSTTPPAITARRTTTREVRVQLPPQGPST